MLRDAAVDLIMKRLGNRSDTSLRNDIINEMVYVQETILEGGPFYPFFLVTEISTAVSTVSDERLTLPSDFLHEWEDGALYYFDAADTSSPWKPLIRDDWDALKAAHTTADDALPTHYDIAGNYFLLTPTPDQIYTYKFRYYGADVALTGPYGTNNIENIWLDKAADWLIGEVGAIIATQYLLSDKLHTMFVAQATRGRKRIKDLTTSMEESNKSRTMGED